MRRQLMTWSVAIALSIGTAGSVQAADAVVVSRTGMPAGVAAEARVCRELGPAQDPNGFPPVQESVSHVDGPSAPPQGMGSVAVVPPRGADGGLRVTSLPMPLADLTAISVAGRTSLTNQSIRIDLAVHGGASGNSWLATRELPVDADAWTSVDFEPLTFTWLPVNGGATYNHLTMAEFVDAVGPSEGGQLDLIFLTVHIGACDGTPGNAIYYLDDLRVGVSGVNTIYDFEGPTAATSTTLSLGKATITAGGHTTASTQVSAAGAVELLARPAGSATFSTVTTVATDPTGHASVDVAPLTNTTYQWHYTGSSGYGPSSSELQTLGVRSKVSIGVADSALTAGDLLIVRGKVTPRAQGTKVTLWRARPDGQRLQLGTSRLNRRGRYTVTVATKSPHRWRVFTTVVPTSTNLSGTSRKVTITIS